MSETPFLRVLDPHTIAVHPNGRQYGHLALELLMGLEAARAHAATLVILPPRRPVNPALLVLQSSEVATVRAHGARRLLLQGRWLAAAVPQEVREHRSRMMESLRDEVIDDISDHMRDRRLPPNLRDALRVWRTRLASRQRSIRAAFADEPPYFRRRLVRQPVAVDLPPPFLFEAEDDARAAGIPAGPIVAIHAREAGFKRGFEVHEKHRRLGKRQVRNDDARNADIETYGPAVDRLVRAGYTVVRIGDPSMRPFVRPGVIDLARSRARTPLLDVYVLLRSRFVICGEAGPSGVSYLTNTPVLTVNATDPISSYPVRDTGLLLLKHVVDRVRGAELTANELLSDAYQRALRNTDLFEYRDNTPAEILDAVDEMLMLLEGAPEDARQSAFRDDAARATARLMPQFRYVRKWGLDEGFLGDGRIARASLRVA